MKSYHCVSTCMFIRNIVDSLMFFICCTAPTLAPRDVLLTAVDSTTLSASWMPPPLEHQNGIIREYRFNITERETGMAYYQVAAAPFLTLSSLHPFYTYICTVAAFTIARGPYSVEVNITMPEDGMFYLSNCCQSCH